MYVEHSEFCHLDADCNLGSRIRADNNQWLPLVGFLLFRSERPIVRLSSLRSSACLCLVPTVSHLPGYCRIFIAQTYQQFDMTKKRTYMTRWKTSICDDAWCKIEEINRFGDDHFVSVQRTEKVQFVGKKCSSCCAVITGCRWKHWRYFYPVLVVYPETL